MTEKIITKEDGDDRRRAHDGSCRSDLDIICENIVKIIGREAE